jgi:hypothetical protein
MHGAIRKYEDSTYVGVTRWRMITASPKSSESVTKSQAMIHAVVIHCRPLEKSDSEINGGAEGSVTDLALNYFSFDGYLIVRNTK